MTSRAHKFTNDDSEGDNDRKVPCIVTKRIKKIYNTEGEKIL